VPSRLSIDGDKIPYGLVYNLDMSKLYILGKLYMMEVGGCMIFQIM
jgi:hypothetical protein